MNRILSFSIFIFSLILSAVIFELMVREFIFDPNYSYLRAPGASWEVKLDDGIPNVTGDHTIKFNRFGYRGELPKTGASPLILVSGGSTVEDWVLTEEETWVDQLQVHLNSCFPDADTLNLGKSGANARHNLLQLREVRKYLPRADVYVILLGLNDFLFDLRIHHSFETPKNWWLNQSFSSIAGNEGVYGSIALLKRLYDLHINETSVAHSTSHFGDYMASLYTAYSQVQPNQWVRKLPQLTEHLQTYKNTIAELKSFADAQGAKIYFVTQPYVWSTDMSEKTLSQLYAGFIGPVFTGEKIKWYTPEAMRKGLMAYNDTLREVCEEKKLMCIDAAQKLPHESAYFYDDFHFSELGASTLAKIVADEIKHFDSSCQ